VGRTVTVADVLADVRRDRPFYEQSGGGVTFSGGEPLLQHDFLSACLRGCRQEGLHTALDTSGYAPKHQIMDLLGLTDLFLFDLKLMDDFRHRQFTGVSVQPILENLQALDRVGAEIWVRVPIIPGLNDDEDNVAAIGNFVADLSHTRRVHVLPFHEAGAPKQERLGKRERDPLAGSQLRAELETVVQNLSICGLEVHVGG
jgi:pyruvate formate lyase activating enzyme